MLEALFVKRLVGAAAAALWLAFLPLHPALLAVVAMPVLDLLLGLVAAVRMKEPLSSAGIKRTVAKMTLYLVATILAFVTETWLTGPVIPCVKVITGLIGITELKSCLEHLDELGGGSLFKAAINALAPPQPPKDPQL